MYKTMWLLLLSIFHFLPSNLIFSEKEVEDKPFCLSEENTPINTNIQVSGEVGKEIAKNLVRS